MIGSLTLKTGFNHVEGMDGQCRYGTGREAGDGLDQRGRETRMVFTHVIRAVLGLSWWFVVL